MKKDKIILKKEIKKFLDKYWNINFESTRQNINMLQNAVDLIIDVEEYLKD
jgi:hypothetical protein